MEARMKELETFMTRASNYHLNICPYLGISPAPGIDPSAAADQLADSLGALSVSDTGNTQYYGPTAGTEALLSIEVSNDPSPDEFPPTFITITESFSVGYHGTNAWDPSHAFAQLLAHLPEKPRAWQLVDIYFENGCWSGTPIMRDEVVELLSSAYSYFGVPEGDSTLPAISIHHLAVIYAILALGALVDLALPPYSAESHHYFDLCRAALSARSVFESVSVETIQALVLVSLFYWHGGPRSSMDGAWSVVSLASSLCKSMGLHTGRVPPAASPKQIQRYRILFWETYAIETLETVAVGRPTGTYLAVVNCPFPTFDEEEEERVPVGDAGAVGPEYYRRRWEFIKQVAAPIVETYSTAQAPSYDVIVDLDQRIRRFMHSPMCTSTTDPEFPPGHERDFSGSPTAYMQRRMIRQALLVYIHNHAFVRALRENPDDPYYTSRATSFLSAVRYSSELIRTNIDNFRRHPQLCERWWPTWKSLFNCGIIVGAVAAKCPQNAYAPQALLELFVAVELLERGAAASYRARGALTVLHKLRAKAIAAYTHHSRDVDVYSADADKDADATLDVFAGRTRVIAQTILARDRAQPKALPVLSPTLADPGTVAGANGAHNDLPQAPRALSPALVEYFSSAAAWPESGDQAEGYTHGETTTEDLDLTNIPLFDLGAPPAPPPVDLNGAEDSNTNDIDIQLQPFFSFLEQAGPGNDSHGHAHAQCMDLLESL
ncbi:Zn(2)-C6 fungal-type domain-containing protein [Mycena venus]|uniref:Zn(2)-C6 fungal-type domain-containing protein n=1 Tax=Mycena venus TaxID=2733690 RepID=A0A8H6YE95_9AGAR|nr:Zn(2)-C6 fungal-type domain-containing protein [Mycena venus]